MSVTNRVDNTQDVIDSRDLIDRAYELIDEQLSAFNEQQTDDAARAGEDGAIDLEREDAPHDDLFLEWLKAGAHLDEDKAELAALIHVWRECEDVSDWTYGETLIRDDYFVSYTEQLIDDCYELPKELTSGNWPYRHITIDYEAAADELKDDYMSVDFNGVDYWIRNC